MMRVSKMAQQKPPEPQSLGVFYSILGGWLKPKAGYQLFISIQPFANIIGDYTCRNRDIKWWDYIQGDTPPSSYQYRGGSLLIIS